MLVVKTIVVMLTVIFCNCKEYRRKVACLSVFYRIYHGKCVKELPDLIPPSPFYHRGTRRRLGFHPYVEDIPKIRTKRYASTSIWRTAKEWKCLPADLFPERYSLGLIKQEKTGRGDLESFERYLISSQELEKLDADMVKKWIEDKEMQFVNITVGYRLQISKNKEQSFMNRRYDLKWTGCMNLYLSDISESEQRYYTQESECIATSSQAEDERKLALEHIAKEILKWRRSYQYFKHLCEVEFPEKKGEIKICLMESLKEFIKVLADDYNMAFQRLLTVKLRAMGDLRAAIMSSVMSLDDCLKNKVSRYLESVTMILQLLNKCYDERGLGEYLLRQLDPQ